MVKWREKWVWAVWGMLGILMFLSGFVSGNVVTMVVGVLMAFAYASLCLTFYVESEHRVKRASEAVFLFMAFGVIVYGYAVTRSLILGIILLFAAALFFVAFVLSYLVPKISGTSKNRSADVKDEGEEEGEFAYDVGRELGREIMKGLEENWKRHVIAGVIAAGCGLFSILLKPPWYFIIMVVFIFYQAAYSALSKLFENIGERAKK